MDKDPVSSCLHCDFMTYSTERMKIHSLSTHPGELEKSILKVITKSVSARVRQDDAVYYSSFVDDEGDTSILDVKPNDLTFQTHSSSVTSVNDPGEEVVCKNEPKLIQNLSQHGNPFIKFSDCKVEKVNMMCVLCAYESTNIEKMKCHLITQHSTEPAAVANKSDETSQKLSGTAFFCIKESCSHVTMSCKVYEEHLMSCCPIHKKLSQVEIERLKSSLRFLLKFLRGNSLEPVSGFLNFVSAFKVVHDIHDDLFLTQTANPEVSQAKNHFLINNNVSNIKNQHSHLMDSQSYEHPSLSCQNENTILGNVANSNPEIGHTVDNFLLNDISDVQNHVHYDVQNDIKDNVENNNQNHVQNDIQNDIQNNFQNDVQNDIQNNVQNDIQSKHSIHVNKTKEKREKVDLFRKIAAETEDFAESPKHFSLSCQDNTFSRNIANLNFEVSHTVSDVGNQHSNYMNAAKEKGGQINSFGKMSSETESLSESPGLPSFSRQNEEAITSILAAQYKIFNVGTQELNFSQAKISEHNQQSDKNGNKCPETTLYLSPNSQISEHNQQSDKNSKSPNLSPNSLVIPFFLHSSQDVHTATGSENNHTLKSGHLVDKSQDYNSVDGQLSPTTNNIGTEFLSEMSINSKENVDNTNTVVSSTEGNITHNGICSGFIHTPKDISSVSSDDRIQGCTQNLSEASPIPIYLDPNTAADNTDTDDISFNKHPTLSVKYKTNEDEQSKMEMLAPRNFSSSSEMILDESGHNYFVSGNASFDIDIENESVFSKDTATDCVENNRYDNDGIILKALPRTQRKQEQSLNVLSRGKNIIKESNRHLSDITAYGGSGYQINKQNNEHLDNFPRILVPKSGDRKLSLRKTKLKKENNSKCNLNNLKDKFDNIISGPRVIIEKLNLTNLSGTVFIDSEGNLIEASSEAKSTVNSLDSANGVKKVSHKHGQSVTECGQGSNLVTQIRVESSPTLDKFLNDIILCQLCHLTFPSSLLLEQHTKSHHDGQHSLVKGDGQHFLVKGDGQHSLALRNGQHSLTKCKNREDLKEDRLRTMTSLQNNGVPLKKATEFENTSHCNVSGNQTGGQKDIINATKCTICLKIFTFKSSLNRHMKTQHTEQRSFKCDLCGKNFSFSRSLRLHVKTHDELKLQSEPHSNLKLQSETHDKRETLRCNYCGKGFPDKANLRRHKLIHTDAKLFKCEICHKCFNNRGNKSRHMITHGISTEKRKFKCKDCGKTFGQKHNLRSHLMIHKGEKPFKCDKCGKCFSFKGNLKQHRETHFKSLVKSDKLKDKRGTPTIENTFTCSYCGKSYDKSGKLKRHIRSHTGEKPVNCNVCGRLFDFKSEMKKHMRIHTGEKPFKCKDCGKSFSYNQSLNAHIRLHTGEKPFKCSTCGKSFRCKSSLTKHITLHTGIKRFKCNDCGKSFSHLHILKMHIRTHAGNIPFKCNHCDKSFHFKGHLERTPCGFRVLSREGRIGPPPILPARVVRAD